MSEQAVPCSHVPKPLKLFTPGCRLAILFGAVFEGAPWGGAFEAWESLPFPFWRPAISQDAPPKKKTTTTNTGDVQKAGQVASRWYMSWANLASEVPLPCFRFANYSFFSRPFYQASKFVAP